MFNSRYFLVNPFQAAKEEFIIAENEFYKKAYGPQRNVFLERSGTCALVTLIINDNLYAINLGDCRALLSADSGKNLFQIKRDTNLMTKLKKEELKNMVLKFTKQIQ